MNLLSAIAPLSVLLVGGLMVIAGETTIGVVVAFISGFERLSTPLRELVAYYRVAAQANVQRSEEHTSELQSLMRISYAVFCLKKKKTIEQQTTLLTHLPTLTSTQSTAVYHK